MNRIIFTINALALLVLYYNPNPSDFNMFIGGMNLTWCIVYGTKIIIDLT